jgi:hypothetical protein
VSTSYEFETIDMVELGRNLVPEKPACATGRNRPRLDILRVTPDQVAEGTLVRDLLGTSHNADLVDRADFWAQTTVNAENFTVNDSGEDEEIENLATRFPNRRVSVLLLALLVETVDLGDLAGFVVASDEGDLVRVPSLC